MRYTGIVKNQRRILCVFPGYTPSFGTFQHAFKLMGNVKAFMPPQGLLVIAAYLPASWEVRFVDENIKSATTDDFTWADVVFASGMHIQAPQINDIRARAQAAGKVTVLGGPSVSGAPEMYPEFDYLHVGELGDSTDKLIAILDESIVPPATQMRLETIERTPLHDFPLPAYDKIGLGKYLIGSLQFSSGCPYRCEFCDIPQLYGRQPRLKTPEQLTAELDGMMSQTFRPSAVYFVDDNFIGNRKATKDMLPHLIEWQKRHGYPLQFACEATLNIAKQPEILQMMREAGFITIFVGIETPEAGALKDMRKEHNTTLPMFEAINIINSYGLEVTSGMILGLDSDTDNTEAALTTFIDASNIPVLTINLLQALPKTPLWDRLHKAGRLVESDGLESNVRFLRPYEEVIGSWQRCIEHAYAPERLFERFRYQVDATYSNRIKTPLRGKLSLANLVRGLALTWNTLIYLGIKPKYRGIFWRAALHALKRGQIDTVFNMAFVGHHLITFTKEALEGEQNASFYSKHTKAPSKRMAA
ncbi:radical SAM superfamily enzyme YgiQ (UPF0313 family) [Rhodoligotrophos appendicifer]|uniref:B12-binding domain-containing radical SAM protein n=1 Tax=Rhodoligotrophos appendicifer TaxID=987056 RepID=UPI00117BE186|nr:B12-binding domain-containing radical SAM protein [Rhodoligotrophos appendicifer]